ncbi:MAG TPA: aminomethyltransferase family protein [Pyrinomonadaceae bacterium]|jgi:folate-binding protein YgfZ
MSEAVEQATFRELPLGGWHRARGAEMKERDGWLVPSSYGDARAEYEAVRGGGAGLIDLTPRGRIRVGGSEAVQFLNGLITNDVKALAQGRWMLAAFPNAQGRLLAFARVLNPGGSFLIDTEAQTRAQVFKLLERFALAGDFKAEDLSGETAQLSLQGAGSAGLVAAVIGQEAANVERGRVAQVAWRNGEQLTVMRATHTGEDGFDIFTSTPDAAELCEALLNAGARAVGYDALETLRVEAGLPRFGADMSETNVVLEAGLDEALSFTKGCYVGQEIIARIHWRGHVAKRLAGLGFDGRAAVRPGASIKTLEGREIGRVTSATFSPRLNRTVALGYVKYDYLAHGTGVLVESSGEEIGARVAELPFVRGSWHGPAE